jgi:hypothetical protein
MAFPPHSLIIAYQAFFDNYQMYHDFVHFRFQDFVKSQFLKRVDLVTGFLCSLPQKYLPKAPLLLGLRGPIRQKECLSLENY